MKVAYAGSFDPFTNGHLHLINKAIRIMPGVELTILVANNPDKKHRFSIEERVNIVRKVFENNPRIIIEILPSNRYAVEYAKNIGCNAMIRGIRTEKDFQDESGVYNANKIICPTMETLYIMPDINLSAVSSSLVMALVGPSGWMGAVEQLVPSNTFLNICKKYCIKTADAGEFTGDLSCYDKMPYHNWKHIAYCMAELINQGYFHVDLLRGILLHDAIDPNKRGELNRFSFYGMNAEALEYTWEAIAATDHEHLNENSLKLYQKIIHDIDMSILAADGTQYDKYMMQIRREYVDTKGITFDKFIQGRKEFIKSLLNKDHIFFTSHYSETLARDNLRRELSDLS